MEISYIDKLALKRVLVFVKLRCKTIDDTALVSSPYIGDLLKRLLLDMNPEFDFSLDKSGSEYKEIIETVTCNLKIFYEWNTYNDSLKHHVIVDIFYPFIVNESTIKSLIKEADQIHSNKFGR